MKKIFQPLHLKNHTIPNRIVVSPMCQYTAIDGFANDWHLVHLGQFAIGKAGAIIQEATAITPEGRISYGDLGIWKDKHIEKYKQITHFIKSQGSVPGIQLAHAGRKASTEKPWLGRRQITSQEENGWQTIGPSEIPFSSTDVPPHAMTLSEIKDMVKHFQKATERAVKAGYEIIEIHGAHGYLVHQFLSPLINNRTDEYGGSFKNRIRFLLEIVDEVQKVLNKASLWVRLSATDWAENGWNIDESIELCKILKEKGVEVIDVSSGGGVAHQNIISGHNYQVPFAERIKSETGILTGTVGLITNGKQANEILENNQADLVLIGREFLRNPQFVLRIAEELEEDVVWPSQYERGKETK